MGDSVVVIIAVESFGFGCLGAINGTYLASAFTDIFDDGIY